MQEKSIFFHLSTLSYPHKQRESSLYSTFSSAKGQELHLGANDHTMQQILNLWLVLKKQQKPSIYYVQAIWGSGGQKGQTIFQPRRLNLADLAEAKFSLMSPDCFSKHLPRKGSFSLSQDEKSTVMISILSVIITVIAIVIIQLES